jgi:hypothetical protein
LRKIGIHHIAKLWYDVLDAMGQISQEDQRIGVGVVKLVPNELLAQAANKIGHERCFAGSGICCYQRHRSGEIRS